jgi:hypothetical protein
LPKSNGCFGTNKDKRKEGELMGILGGISLVDVGGVLTGIGALAKDLRSAITGEISPEKKAEIEQKILELESAAQNAQVQVNAIEAASPHLFVSGWRPAAGWCCVSGLFYTFIAQPVLSWASANFGWTTPPSLDTSLLTTLLFALLGLGGFRLYEKIKDVARN